jgi:predicted dehydrogenase
MLNIACIGVGGKGSSDTDQAGKHGNIVAICDIDDGNLAAKAEKFPRAKKYNDFRMMFDAMHQGIDAVVVSTPDHTHAVAAVQAMKLGKHVYCQKPLTHSVHEARLMRETARAHKVATQMGNQGTADPGFRRGIEMIRAGAIGAVREVHVWTNRPIWPQAPMITARPRESSPVPNGIHWYLFLGPAPDRPYHKATYHPFAWRGWWDFGTGALGDMACHTANLPFLALKLEYPSSVSAESGDLNAETYPAWARVVYEFPAREELPPLRLTWYEGRRDGKRVLPPTELTHGMTMSDSGSLLVGDQGVLYSPHDYGAHWHLLPEEKFRDYQGPPESLPRLADTHDDDENMKIEWLRACRGGTPAMSNFDYAGILTEAVLLGNLAIRAGKKIEWDGPRLRVANDNDANQHLRFPYRAGWSL